MNQVGANVKKLLPSLALGVFITLLAAFFNFAVYDRRLPAMAVGNRIFAGDEDGDAGARDGRRRAGRHTFMRMLAGLVNISDDLATDIMYAVRGPGDYPATADRIAVIAIDEASILRTGAWPWSREDVARLVAKTAEAKVVGVDLLFSEPDRTSLGNYLGSFAKLYGRKLAVDKLDPEVLDNDLRLAREISRARTVLGSVFHNGPEPNFKAPDLIANYSLRVITAGGRDVPMQDALLKRTEHVITDLPVIREHKPPPVGEGYMNLFPAPNGRVRSVPLFAHAPDDAFASVSGQDRRAFPSLALEMMRVALDGDAYRLELRGDVVNIPEFADEYSNGDRYPVKGLSILREAAGGSGEVLRIPLNELGEMEVGFRSRRHDYTVYPAWEVLAGRHDDAFKDKLVLIGGTVEGVGFTAGTGFPDPEVSVVEAHAAMLSTMLKGDFMDSGYQDDYSWQQIAILAAGLAVTMAIIFGDLGLGMAVSGLCLLALVLTNYFLFFKRGMDVGITLPIFSILAVLVVLLVANYLVVGRERRFIRRAFSLNVSPSILGYLETHPDRLSSLQGENRDMSVLFSDIRGFTSISERMTAPDLARFLNEYFTPMSDIVMKNTGTVDKFIGDALMAFWNAPTDNPRHAIDAACSALDMVAKLGELQNNWTSRGLPRVSIGCGINSGPMFAGYMGSEQRKNYTVMGDNVNIASRLEDLNKVYSTTILITEKTLRELHDEFVCRVVDKVRVSGKEESVIIYELLGRGPASEEECEELAAFARVFELYQMREFATAESLLKELVFIRPTPLYKMYLDRLAIYKALPPPLDWDGTFSMTHK